MSNTAQLLRVQSQNPRCHTHHFGRRSRELIEALESPRLRELAKRGDIHLIRRGDLVMAEGEPGDALVILLDGRLRVYSTSGGLRPREVTYGLCNSGQVVGEMSLDGAPRSASVVALCASWCCFVSRDELMAFISEEPMFAHDLMEAVVVRARQATRTIQKVLFSDTFGRLREFLLSNTEPLPDGRLLVKDRMTHALIAQHIGASREMVTRLLRDLMVGGHLERNEQRQLVINPPLPKRW